MKAWRRSSRSVSTGAVTPPVATILSVTASGPGEADFLFDTAVTNVGDPNGFDINGNDGINVASGLATATLTIDFPSGPAPGDPWTFTSAIANLTFSNGATIADAAGTVL